MGDLSEASMASVDIVSFRVVDTFGKTRTVPIAIASGATLANITSWAQAVETAMDAVMDGYVDRIEVALNISLADGHKSAVSGGNRVGVGARLTYDVDTSDYSDAVFVPTWENAGYAGENVLASGVYATFEDLLHTATNTITATDKDGLAFVDFLRGEYAQRK